MDLPVTPPPPPAAPAAAPAAPAPLPPLTSALVVLRSHSGVPLAALPHVTLAISEFLDYGLPQFWSLPRACQANSLSLLRRLAMHGVSVGVDPYYWKYQCSQGLVFAVKHDNLQMVEWLHACCPSVLPFNAMIEAARSGNVRMLEWLSKRHEKAPWVPQMMDEASSAGQIEMLHYLSNHSKDAGCTDDIMMAAIQGGHLESVKWLHAHSVAEVFLVDSEYFGRVVIECGHVELARYLFDHPYHDELDLTEGFCAALELGDIELAQWLLSKQDKATVNFRHYPKPMDCAAKGGHLHVLQWLHEQELFPHACITKQAMINPVQSGSLEVVQWLHENRSSDVNTTSTEAMDYAASGGHLDIVKWLHENQSEGCSTNAMDSAAEHGHIEVVKWLQANRFEGCTRRAMDGAAGNGHLDVVQWLHTNRAEGCTTKAMNHAAMRGHLDAVKWLHENRREGCTPDAMDYAAGWGYLDVVKWLHENRSEGCTTEAMRLAAMRGYFDVLLFLHANRREGCPRGTIYIGEEYIDLLEILQWLHANYPDAVNLDRLRAEGGYMSEVLEYALRMALAS